MSDFTQLLLTAAVLAVLAGTAAVVLVIRGHLEFHLHRRPPQPPQKRAQPPARM